MTQSYQDDSDTDIDFELGEENNPEVRGYVQQVQVAGGGAEADQEIGGRPVLGVAEPADGENNEEQAQRKSGRIRKPPARYGRSPQERKKKKGLARKRPKQRTQEAIIMWKGVRYGPPLEQEQEGTEDSEEQEDTEDSEQEGTVSVGEGMESD